MDDETVPLTALYAVLAGDTNEAMRIADGAGIPAVKQEELRDMLADLLHDTYQDGFENGYQYGVADGKERGEEGDR